MTADQILGELMTVSRRLYPDQPKLQQQWMLGFLAAQVSRAQHWDSQHTVQFRKRLERLYLDTL